MLADAIARGRSRLVKLIPGTGERDGATAAGRRRVHAECEDGIVVFVVGMRINAFWKIHRWLPIFLVGPRLVGNLRAESDSGLLGSWTFVSPPRTVGFVQYWDSFESLREYAHDPDRGHVDAWQDYTERGSGSAVGIWHETYRVDSHESIYDGVPPRGLGAADGSELVAATGRFDSATGRITSPVTADGSE